jgi:hypothetical protein
MKIFAIDDKQKSKLKKWQEKVKKEHGQYGGYDYIFTPNGIGVSLVVVSHITKKSIDLTNVENW